MQARLLKRGKGYATTIHQRHELGNFLADEDEWPELGVSEVMVHLTEVSD